MDNINLEATIYISIPPLIPVHCIECDPILVSGSRGWRTSNGLEYSAIVIAMRENHHINISLRTVKRKLASMSLRRYKVYTQQFVCNIVSTMLNGPGASLGYRLLR